MEAKTKFKLALGILSTVSLVGVAAAVVSVRNALQNNQIPFTHEAIGLVMFSPIIAGLFAYWSFGLQTANEEAKKDNNKIIKFKKR